MNATCDVLSHDAKITVIYITRSGSARGSLYSHRLTVQSTDLSRAVEGPSQIQYPHTNEHNIKITRHIHISHIHTCINQGVKPYRYAKPYAPFGFAILQRRPGGGT